MSQEQRAVLEQMGAGPETAERAIKLVLKAKPRTAPGSGHELGEMSTGLVPICGLLASEQLNNQDITVAAAQPASCLKKAQFQRAYQILKTVLGEQGASSRRAPVGFKSLIDRYIPHSIQAARVQEYCQEVQAHFKMQAPSSDMSCAIFHWVSTCAKVPHLPSIEEVASDYKIPANTMDAFIKRLNKDLATTKRTIAQETRNKPSGAPSPTKAPSLVTPGRSGRPKRELLSKQTVQKSPSKSRVDEEGDDDLPLPETPTKKRRLDSEPSAQKSAARLFESTIRASSSRATLDEVRTRSAPTPQGSPLKRTATLPEPEDVDMDDASSHSEGHEAVAKARSFKRFRPVYFDHLQWNARDPRLERLWKRREEQKQALITLHGHPFER
ncbi:hypothetical protein BKA70DRAFT_1267885 [Coprinopsis sp. MPI-PUGE-AT-0042]|nr:hypothetical protein BKA70DRAFT_1267885 [Coprinopsis sp. MPI-PUGE-AT-0042]